MPKRSDSAAQADLTGPLSWCPQPPDWSLAWDGMVAGFPFLSALDRCPQDAEWHAEGDVGTHTRMVCRALTELDGWRRLPAADRAVVFLGTLLHDIGKPSCTREEGGRITSRGHARAGAGIARQALWSALPFEMREQVIALVRRHGAPLHAVENPDPARAVITTSTVSRNDWLALVAEADVRGRVCADQDDLLLRIRLFEELCREHGCWDRAYPFASEHSRFEYFRRPDRDPGYAAHDSTTFEVVLMSGLPASGKDTWIRAHRPDWPVVALDAIRSELSVDPSRDQGAVIRLAKERARQHLRTGSPFVWNATNVTRMQRDPLVDLFASYGARIRMVYCEAPMETVFRRNRARSRQVPDAVIQALAEKLEPPDLTESHSLETAITL